MSRFLRRFALIAVVGSIVFALAQTPAQAQYRRPIIVPRINTYVNSNPYVLPGLTYNQYATFSALNPGNFSPYAYGYYNPYRPVYAPYAYPTVGYPAPVVMPRSLYNPYGYYNPYFASYGLYP
jgi:hypothetical protein